MFLCETASMRTTLDLPDPLFKHLKTRAAQEGRTLRDLVVELVEKGLSARDLVDAQQRFQARPLITGTSPMRLPPSQLNSANLSDILSEEDDERARQILQSR
jgi:plasmid stability protein